MWLDTRQQLAKLTVNSHEPVRRLTSTVDINDVVINFGVLLDGQVSMASYAAVTYCDCGVSCKLHYLLITCLLLVLNSNLGHVFYRFRDITRKSPESPFLLTPEAQIHLSSDVTNTQCASTSTSTQKLFEYKYKYKY